MKKVLLTFFLLNFIAAYSAGMREQAEVRTSFYVYPVALNKTGGEISSAAIIQEEERKATGKAAGGGVLVGAAAGGLVGGVPGAVVGGAAGGVVGAHCCQSVYKDIDWIESSCLDVVFHAKRGDAVVYDLMIRLRPMPPGWRKSASDAKKSFKSTVQVFWIVGDENTYSTLFPKDRLAALKSDLTLPQDSGCCSFVSCCSSKGGVMEYSSAQHRNNNERELEQDSVFEGTLSTKMSIGEILSVVDQMRVNGKFPKSSWSGRAKRCCRKEKDVLNPVIFTYTLLHKLRAFGNVSEDYLRTNLLGATPITRTQAVQNLRKYIPAGIRINEIKANELIENSADSDNRL